MGLGRVEAKTCPVEISPNCPGHLGHDRFSSCLLRALYFADHDAVTGDVDGFGYWVALTIDDQAVSLDSDRGEPVTIPAGTYAVIVVNDQGHIGMDLFGTAEEAQARFDDWESGFSGHLAAVEARECAITSSTGRIGR